MDAIFPGALRGLKEEDPEVYGIIQDEKVRQWCAPSLMRFFRWQTTDTWPNRYFHQQPGMKLGNIRTRT
jgi:hypothetical protein